MNKRLLIVAVIALVLTLHPWTWAKHGTREIIVPAIAYVLVCFVVFLLALRKGDVSSPFRRPQRRRPTLESRRPDDVTRAAEELLRRSRRR
ncbi:MAG TPA: hypothetical protein VE591_07725 [Candidatus Acidoferrum sp.]|nr:hypothetical protein [Candidatus Acidoferrum sp.]